MKTKNTLIATATLMLASIGLYAAPITIDTVVVGDAGNAVDTGGLPGRGAVNYEFNMSYHKPICDILERGCLHKRCS